MVTVQLPYAVTPENVSLTGKSIEGYPITPLPADFKIEDNQINREFSDLEPGPQDNIFVDGLEPERYQRLVQARRAAVNAQPTVTRAAPSQTPFGAEVMTSTPLPTAQIEEQGFQIPWLPPTIAAGIAIAVLLGWRIKKRS